MESYRLHIVLLFISFALSLTVLIDGVTHLAMAKIDFPETPNGKVGYTNLMMYEIIVPVLSIFGLAMHILGLHHGFISYIAETSTEGLFLFVGTILHSASWLTIGTMWTTCEVNTMKVRYTTISGQAAPSIVVNRGGPSFCPQHGFLDGGYMLDGPIPKIKLGLAWASFVLTLLHLVCAFKGWMYAKHGMTDGRRDGRPVRGLGVQLAEYDMGKSVTADILGTYDYKV